MRARRQEPRRPLPRPRTSRRLLPQRERPEVSQNRPVGPEERRQASRRRTRRLLVRGLIVLGVLLVLDGVWVTARAVKARNHLLAARSLVAAAQQDVRGGHLSDALALASRVKAEGAAAHADTDDLLWRATARLPLVGRSMTDVTGIAAAVTDVAGQILPNLVSATDDLRNGHLRQPDGSISVASLNDAGTRLQLASDALQASRGRVAALSASGLISAVRDARTELLAQLDALRQQFSGALVATRLAPRMLGETGPRSYFFALENTAEARGTGGIIGGFARITIDNGHIQLVDAGGDGRLPAYGTPTVVLPADYENRWGSFEPSQDWRDANLSPHFPFAVQTLAGLYKRHFGTEPDGVIALDPTAAGYLLDATGPVTLPDGTVLRGSSLTSYVESDLYRRFSDRTQRQFALADVTKAIFTAVQRGQGDPVALLSALGRADGEGRLLIGSTHDDEESALAGTYAGGALPSAGSPFSEVVVTNASGDKLDYYLDRDVRWSAGGCSAPTRSSTVSVTLTNTAPATGLPDYVSGANGVTRSRSVPAYEVREFVSVYATRGASLAGAELDGAPVTVVTALERDLPVASLYVDLPPAGGRHVLTVHWTEPTTAGAPTLRAQPLARAQNSVVAVPTCPSPPA